MTDIITRARLVAADVDRILGGTPEAAELRAGMRERMSELADDARQIEGDARRLAKESPPDERDHFVDVADRAARMAELASAPTDAARAEWLTAVPVT